MSWGKSADRSGCSLVAEAVLIAGNHCLTDLGRGDLWGHESRGAISGDCRMLYAVGDPTQGPQKARFCSMRSPRRHAFARDLNDASALGRCDIPMTRRLLRNRQ